MHNALQCNSPVGAMGAALAVQHIWRPQRPIHALLSGASISPIPASKDDLISYPGVTPASMRYTSRSPSAEVLVPGFQQSSINVILLAHDIRLNHTIKHGHPGVGYSYRRIICALICKSSRQPTHLFIEILSKVVSCNMQLGILCYMFSGMFKASTL